MANLLPEQIGNMPRNKWAILTLAPIHENTFLFRMSMKIDEHKNTTMLQNRFFCKVYLRTVGLVIVMPDAV